MPVMSIAVNATLLTAALLEAAVLSAAIAPQIRPGAVPLVLPQIEQIALIEVVAKTAQIVGVIKLTAAELSASELFSKEVEVQIIAAQDLVKDPIELTPLLQIVAPTEVMCVLVAQAAAIVAPIRPQVQVEAEVRERAHRHAPAEALA